MEAHAALAAAFAHCRCHARSRTARRAAATSVRCSRLRVAVGAWARTGWLRQLPDGLARRGVVRRNFSGWVQLVQESRHVAAVLLVAAVGWHAAATKLKTLLTLRRHQLLGWGRAAAARQQMALQRAAALARAMEAWTAPLRREILVHLFSRRLRARRGLRRLRRVGIGAEAHRRLARAARSWLLLGTWRGWRRFCSLHQRYDRLLAPLRRSAHGGMPWHRGGSKLQVELGSCGLYLLTP
uniref:Uncharacterized protein n=1 Tax=Haptolina ericina TaxID=156174 RepID=A0A7S3AK41_9EUKA